MSALALLARGENKCVKIGDHDTVILSSHAIPGNEGNVNRVIDGLLRAGVEVVHCGHRRRARHRPRPGRRAEDVPVDRPRPEWFVPIHGEYRHMVANAKLGYADGRPPRPRARVRGRRRARARATTGSPRSAVCRPATCTSTASSATSARACCATARCSPRRASSSSSSRSTSRRGKVLTGPEIITRGWVYAPEAEDLLDEACDTVAAVRREVAGAPACATSSRSSATCAGRPASSSTSAPSAGR